MTFSRLPRLLPVIFIGFLGWIVTEALAQTVPRPLESQVGSSCGKAAHSTDFDTLTQCTSTTTGGTMQKAPLFVGKVTAPPYSAVTCDANKAGMLQWTGSSFQGCNGTAWADLGGGSIQGAGDIGEVVIWPAGTVPSGYLECNGAAVSRATQRAVGHSILAPPVGKVPKFLCKVHLDTTVGT